MSPTYSPQYNVFSALGSHKPPPPHYQYLAPTAITEIQVNYLILRSVLAALQSLILLISIRIFNADS